jgi:hypothetical protein
LRTGEGAQGAAYDKLAVERVYAATLENVAVLRLPAVYGWPDQSRIEAYAGPMLDGADEIVLHPRLARWRFARVLNRNAGHAVSLAALGNWSGFWAWNVAEPVSPTEAEWVARIGKAVGWRGRIVESDAAEAPGFNPVPPSVPATPDCDYAASGTVSIWARRNWAGERWPCRSISQCSL